jgi:CDP-4-dehydro-6-deoxyglucose reductase
MDHQVKLQSSGKQFIVRDDETILDAALRQGIVLPYSCRTGSCGTCKARIVSGSVDHGDYDADALSEQERQDGMALLCQSRAESDLEVDARELLAAEEIQIRMLPCRVVRLERLAHDVMGVHLKLPQNQSFNFLPGQYIDILLRDGRRRSFSIANPPGEHEILELHIRRVPDGHFTSHVFESMKEGDLLRFQGPLGTFFLRDDARRPLLLMAGGTGMAPIKAIIEGAFREAARLPMHLFWGVRARRDLYMADELEAWRRSHDNFQYTVALSEPAAEDAWDGRRGWVHEALLERYPDLEDYDVYASGPPPMIDAARAAFSRHGLPADQLFYDSFEFAADVPRR